MQEHVAENAEVDNQLSEIGAASGEISGQPVNEPVADQPSFASGKKPRQWLIGAVLIAVLLVGGLGWYGWRIGWVGGTPVDEVGQPKAGAMKRVEFNAGVFAAYQTNPIQVTPSLPEYTITAGELVNLGAIEADEERAFSEQELAQLVQDHLMMGSSNRAFFSEDGETTVDPDSRVDDMVDLYRDLGGSVMPENRKPEDAVFITSDFLLHLYHSFIDKVFQNIEEDTFHPELLALSTAMYQQALAVREEVGDEGLQESLDRVAAFFLVPTVLLTSSQPTINSFDREAVTESETSDVSADSIEVVREKLQGYKGQLPDALFSKVGQEIEYIYAADALKSSPLYDEFRSRIGLTNPEDYTQYQPRSHYTKSSLLRSYFRAMMWYGRQGFNVKSEELTRDAAVTVFLMQTTRVEDEPAIASWETIYLPTVFFVGRSDDLTIYNYADLLGQVYGKTPVMSDLADTGKLNEFKEAAKVLEGPAILGDAFMGDAVFDATKEGLLEETKAFRFMGQRFIPDSYMFTRLTQGDEQSNEETGQSLPSTPTSLMIMSLLGSSAADTELNAWVVENAPNSDKVIYKVMGVLEREFEALNEADWTQNIYWTWLYSLKSLFAPAGAGYPQFMQRPVWEYKSLQTASGSWTELRHDTLLYAKQSYAELGGGGPRPTPPPVPKGYVEPNPVFFERLQGLVKMTHEGLSQRELLHPVYEDRVVRFEESLKFLEGVVVKELENESISDVEYERVRTMGHELSDLVYPLEGDMLTEGNARSAIIADVHTDIPTAQIMYEATGIPKTLYVVVKDQGGARLTRGVVYSYYEFTQPLAKRLTDEDWQGWVYEGAGSMPESPEWTGRLQP